ncbi:hypothetical protein BV509_21165 [Rhodovulum sulfidophilum]|uniref:Acyltransferase n=1 Tax=Rhodovulum visakhapatnamense TaxID=364297 RepID=A0ABS1RAY5_9RHOB|nr:acyltransferase [Rhodovulum visakhapatnamense]MBL3568921.1 acyltransferase [Rhodovulum visakhapatnamense]MBL3576801.1 acyltransferase [Rhodovulum visakhapatnamense]OLS42258.1 hypothetical protein BV509_21165 [Rhodovulum sulfidophilum]
MPAERIEWLDIAKGIAILLVVFHHTLLYLGFLDIRFQPYWEFNSVFMLLLMPLFFFCTGITAASAVHRAPHTFWHKRLLPMVWVLMIWTLIYLAADQVLPMRRDGQPVRFDLLHPQMNLWFIWVLAIFTALAPLLVRLNGPAVIAVFLGLAALWHGGLLRYEGTLIYPKDIQGILNHAPFYMAGLYFAPRIIAFLAERGRARLLLAGAGTVFAGLVLGAELMPAADEILDKAARFAGVAFGAALATEIARVGGLRRVFSAIGTRTLEIFLGHQLFIAGSATAVMAFGWTGVATGIVLTPAIALFAVAGSVALRELFGAARMDFIYAPPRPVAHRPPRSPVRAAQG